MGSVSEPTLWACCAFCIALGVSSKYLIDNVKTLRERSHEYGNALDAHEARLKILEMNVERLRDGKFNGRH